MMFCIYKINKSFDVLYSRKNYKDIINMPLVDCWLKFNWVKIFHNDIILFIMTKKCAS